MTLIELRDAVVVALNDETRWTAGVLARNGDGYECTTDDQRAICFCSLGHLMRLAPMPLVYDLADMFLGHYGVFMGKINDGPNGRLEVQRMLRELPLEDSNA